MVPEKITVAEIDTSQGLLEVTRVDEVYTITVGGVVRHPGISADEAVGAMAHYLHGAENTLSRRKSAPNLDTLLNHLYLSGMSGPRHGLSKYIGDLLLEAYVALGGNFENLSGLKEVSRLHDEAARQALSKSTKLIKLLTSPDVQANKLPEGLELDAIRWNLFVNNSHFRMVGSAGFDHSQYPDVTIADNRNGYERLHFGLEITEEARASDLEQLSDDEQRIHGRNMFNAYIDHLLNESLKPVEQKE